MVLNIRNSVNEFQAYLIAEEKSPNIRGQIYYN